MKKAILLIILLSANLSFIFSQSIKLSLPQPKGDQEIHIGDWFNDSFETYINIDYPAIQDTSSAKAFLVTASVIPVYNDARDFTANVTLPGKPNVPLYVAKGKAGTITAKIKLENLSKAGKYQCVIETNIGKQTSTTLLTIDRKVSSKKAKSFIVIGSKPIYTQNSTAELEISIKDTMQAETKFHHPTITDFTYHFNDKEAAYPEAEFGGLKEKDSSSKALILTPNETKPIEIEISNLKSAGKYTGKVHINGTEKFEEVTEFTIYRKRPLIWALIAILVGIGLNYFITWFQKTLSPFNNKRLEIAQLKDRLDLIKANQENTLLSNTEDVFNHLENRITGLYATNRSALVNPNSNKSYKENYDILALKLRSLPIWLENYQLYISFSEQVPSYKQQLTDEIGEYKGFFRAEFTTKAIAEEALKALPVFGTLLETIEEEEVKRKTFEKKVAILEEELMEEQEDFKEFSNIFTENEKGNLADLFKRIREKEIPRIKEKIAEREFDSVETDILAIEVRLKKYLVGSIKKYLIDFNADITICEERKTTIINASSQLENQTIGIQNLENEFNTPAFIDGKNQLNKTQELATEFIPLTTSEVLNETAIDQAFDVLMDHFKRIPRQLEDSLIQIDHELTQLETTLSLPVKNIYTHHELATSKDFQDRSMKSRSIGLEQNSRNINSAKDKITKTSHVNIPQTKSKKISYDEIPSTRVIVNQMLWQNAGFNLALLLITCISGISFLWIGNTIWGTTNDLIIAILWGLGLQAAGSQANAKTVRTELSNLGKPNS